MTVKSGKGNREARPRRPKSPPLGGNEVPFWISCGYRWSPGYVFHARTQSHYEWWLAGNSLLCWIFLCTREEMVSIVWTCLLGKLSYHIAFALILPKQLCLVGIVVECWSSSRGIHEICSRRWLFQSLRILNTTLKVPTLAVAWSLKGIIEDASGWESLNFLRWSLIQLRGKSTTTWRPAKSAPSFAGFNTDRGEVIEKVSGVSGGQPLRRFAGAIRLLDRWGLNAPPRSNLPSYGIIADGQQFRRFQKSSNFTAINPLAPIYGATIFS